MRFSPVNLHAAAPFVLRVCWLGCCVKIAGENQRWLIGLICIVVAIILIIVLSVAHKKNKNKITTTRAPLYTTYNGM